MKQRIILGLFLAAILIGNRPIAVAQKEIDTPNIVTARADDTMWHEYGCFCQLVQCRRYWRHGEA